MDQLSPFCRYVHSNNFDLYKGGSKFRNGDVIMARITPCLENGKTAYVSSLGEDEVAFGSTEFIVLRNIENKSDSKFIYYLSISPTIRDIAIKSMIGSSGRQRVQVDVLENFKMDLPSSLNDQRRIANMLSSLDDKIELNNHINANLEEQAQTLFRRWFVDFEFPNEEGLPYKSNGGAFVDSELGRIPKKWSVKTIADVAELTAGGDKPSVVANKPTGECSVPIFSNGISDEGLYGYTTNAKIFKESVTISARGTIGFVRLRQEPFLPIVRLITATPKTDFVSAKYLYLLLLDKNISGTGTTQQQLTVPDFGRYELIVPTLSVIKNFNKIANIIYDNITFLRHENENLESLRDTFLPKLMNNEIKL